MGSRPHTPLLQHSIPFARAVLRIGQRSHRIASVVAAPGDGDNFERR